MYEPGGLPRLLSEASGRQTETLYDPKGRVRQQLVRSGNPLVLRRTLDYVFDAADRLQSLTDSVSGSLSYTYDDRFDSIRTETGPTGTMTYEYLANGLLDHATPSGGTRLTRGYDNANRLRSITQAAGSGSAQPTMAQTVEFAYDEADRRSRLTLPNGITVDYAWDAGDQLTSLTYRHNGAVIGDLGYGYDILGRRTSSTGSFNRPQLPPQIDLPVNAEGRTQSENGVALSYDANGRLTQDAQFSYAWNELGQLTQVRKRVEGAWALDIEVLALGLWPTRLLGFGLQKISAWGWALLATANVVASGSIGLLTACLAQRLGSILAALTTLVACIALWCFWLYGLQADQSFVAVTLFVGSFYLVPTFLYLRRTLPIVES